MSKLINNQQNVKYTPDSLLITLSTPYSVAHFKHLYQQSIEHAGGRNYFNFSG